MVNIFKKNNFKLKVLECDIYLLLLSLGGFSPFGVYNIIISIIILLRCLMTTYSLNFLSKQELFYFFLLLLINIVFIYHMFYPEHIRYVWIVRYSVIFVFLYIIVACNIRISVKNLNYISLIIFIYIASDIYQLLFDSALFLNGQYRTYGFSFSRIVLSDFVILFVFLLIMIYESDNEIDFKTRIYIYVLKFFCITHIYLSGSRSFIIVILLLCFYKIWVQSHWIRKTFLIGFFAFGFIILQMINERFSMMFDTSFGSNLSRMHFINLGYELWQNNFYFGSGPGYSIDFLSSLVIEDKAAMHFDLLLILSEIGFFGFVVFVILFVKVRNVFNVIMLIMLFLISLQNSLYYTAYFMLIILAIHSLNFKGCCVEK